MNTEFWQTVLGRRSIRRYADRPVPPEDIERIVRAACSAPSAHNSRPWHFTVVTSPQIRDRLVRAMAAAYRKDMTDEGIHPATRARRTERSLALLGRAPVIVIAYLVQSPESAEERMLAVQSVAVATGYLLLAAAACGLGACWYSAPVFCPEVVNQSLGVEADWRPQALVTLGYPAESPRPRSKKPWREIVTYV